MRILILGKNGMLGKELQKVFRNEDFLALGLEDLDITDREKVFEKFFTLQPEIVINATGYTAVDLAETDIEKANAVNGYAVGILAKACREIGATLVHFSTDYVFNGTKKSGYNEEDQTDPLNAYGRSKALGEQLLMDEMEMLNTDHPLEGHYFIIRTSWLYGEHGKNFVDTMLTLGKKQISDGGAAAALKVVDDQHGKPTSAADLAAQVKWLVESNEYPSGVYHITNEGVTSWYDFACEIFRLAKLTVNVVPCRTDEYVRPAKRPAYSTLINNKLPPLRKWQDALKEYLNNKL